MFIPNASFPRLYLCLLILLCTCVTAFSQITNALAFPSPNNSFLGAAGTGSSGTSVGVDLYTGTAQINIPICNLASRELSIPISLDYTGSRGIRVQDIAGSEGLGWQLNAGGSVSRVVRGFPDEQTNGYLGVNQWGKVVANNYGNGITWTSAQQTAITGFNGGSWGLPTADGEPDLFYVKTPFFGFQFTFDENGNAVVSNANGIKVIAPNNFLNTSATNPGFIVIDDAGNEYNFGSSSASVEMTTAKLYGTNYSFPTTWYLDKILTYNAKDTINLSYTNYFATEVFNHFESNTYYAGSTSVLDTTSITTTVTPPLVIAKISTSLGEADFVYAAGRRDDANAVSLSTIQLKSYNPQSSGAGSMIYLQTYNFGYSYFNTTSSDPRMLRLRLDNISEVGNTSATLTPVILKSFTYSTVNLPSRSSLSQVDFWGYYTAPATNPYNEPLLPSQAYAVADVLTNISDLAGASYQLSYALNDFYYSPTSSNLVVGGLRVSSISKIIASTGETLTTQYSYVDASGHSTGQILDYTFNIVSISCSLGITESLSETPANINDLNGNFIGYSSVKTTISTGGYTISTFSNFSSPGSGDSYNYLPPTSGAPDMGPTVSMAYKRGLLLDYTVYNAAGSLISEDATPLANYLSLTSPVAKKAWGYHWGSYGLNVGGSGCSASLSSNYWTVVENFRPSVTTHTDYDQNNPAKFVSTTTTYTYAANNRLVQTATISDSKGQSYVKTTYHPDDTGTPLIATELTALTAMVNANKINVPIHEISNRNGSVRETHYSYSGGILNSNNLFSNTYLTSITDYKTVGTTRTQIRQKNFNYDVNTSNLISSNGYTGPSTATLVGKPVSYLYGYNSSYPIARIENANSTTSFSQGSGTLLGNFNTSTSVPISLWNSGSLSFSVYASGTFGSTITVYYTITGPSPQSGNATVSAGGFVLAANLTGMLPGNYMLTFTTYSPTGSYTPTFYFSGTYPSLLTNSTNQFFYEGFENYPLGGNTVVGGAHSGNVYYSGSTAAYTIPFVIPDSRSYTLQYYRLVSGSWVFNEQPYTGSINLTGAIDDVRIFPSDALMTSYTYNPLVGMTSQTDPSGKTRSSQYDGLNRLQTIRDQDNNILKQYDYEYQLLVVPVYNNVQSGTFTKTNCPTGYTGLPVTYTVPAHTYSSYIGQTDADGKALADVSANGQNYANAQSTTSACSINAPIISGANGVYAGGPTSSGTISGLAGNTVHVSMGVSGVPGYSLSLTIKSGSTVIASDLITTPSGSFSFVMPSSGVVSFTLVYSGSSGGGSFSVSY